MGTLLAGLALGGAALEAVDAATGVDELLAAGVEGVAVRADLDVNLGLRGARLELVAARAADVGLDVLGVDIGLHGRLSVSTHAVSARRLRGPTAGTCGPPRSRSRRTRRRARRH